MGHHHAARLRVAFVTCSDVGGITADDARIASALEERGCFVEAQAWDLHEPAAVDAFVIRSPWNYHLAAPAFLSWIEDAAKLAPVYNDPSIVRWNAHKRYLLELESAGVPVAPTALCTSGRAWRLSEILTNRGWHEAVIKPAVSASSHMTAIVGATPHHALQTAELTERFVDDGQAHLERILATGDALVQPFMPEIFTRGERSLIYIDGEFSHCVQKDAFTTGPGGGTATHADDAERSIAQRALATLAVVPLYARVDLLRNAEGREHLMELELIDPELYIRYSATAAERFATALLAKCTNP